jgi:hypothetical protein
VQIRYRDFALANDESGSNSALLPSELGFTRDSAHLLSERVLGSSESESGFLYFRLPTRRLSSLRVDLEAANDTPSSRNFVALHFNR